MSRSGFFHTLWRAACYLLLTLVCSGQVYQSAHLHHVHEEGSIVFTVGAHSISPAVSHAETHHHHGEESSHESDSEHKYTNQIDWSSSRAKYAMDSSFDAPWGPVAVYSTPVAGDDRLKNYLQAIPCPKEQYASFLVIRGPPESARSEQSRKHYTYQGASAA